MRQILVNLLTNAVKFSYKGRIIITIDSKQLSATNKHEIRFCVKDEGIGIAPEAVDSLFKPFTQADSSMNRKFVCMESILITLNRGNRARPFYMQETMRVNGREDLGRI